MSEYTFLVTITRPPGTSVPQLRQILDNAICLHPHSKDLLPKVRRADRKSTTALLDKLTLRWQQSYEFKRKR